MLQTVCILCRKQFTIDSKDPQYYKLKSGQSKSYVCTTCGSSIKKDAVSSTGIDPDQLDDKDKFIR